MFIPVGKSTPAHRAGAPTARERWVAPARWVSPIVRSPLWQVHPPCGSTSNCSLPEWRAANRTHPPCGSHPLLTSSGCSCTVGRGRFPHRYKPSSLLRPHIADTSALLMLELGLMPVVTTLGGEAASKWRRDASLTAPPSAAAARYRLLPGQ